MIPAEPFAQTLVFDTSQPEEVDVTEILFRPTRQELWMYIAVGAPTTMDCQHPVI